MNDQLQTAFSTVAQALNALTSNKHFKDIRKNKEIRLKDFVLCHRLADNLLAKLTGFLPLVSNKEGSINFSNRQAMLDTMLQALPPLRFIQIKISDVYQPKSKYQAIHDNINPACQDISLLEVSVHQQIALFYLRETISHPTIEDKTDKLMSSVNHFQITIKLLISLYPNQASFKLSGAKHNLASALLHQGNTGEAIRLIREARNCAPLDLCYIESNGGGKTLSIKQLEKYFSHHYQIFDTLTQYKQHEEAEETLLELIACLDILKSECKKHENDITPYIKSTYHVLGKLYWVEGSFRQAKEAFTEAEQQIGPGKRDYTEGDFNIWLTLSKIHRQLKEPENCQRILEKAKIAWDKHSPLISQLSFEKVSGLYCELHFALAQLHDENNQWDQSEKLATLVLEEYSEYYKFYKGMPRHNDIEAISPDIAQTRKVQLHKQMAKCHSKLGFLALKTLRFPEAYSHMLSALNIYEKYAELTTDYDNIVPYAQALSSFAHYYHQQFIHKRKMVPNSSLFIAQFNFIKEHSPTALTVAHCRILAQQFYESALIQFDQFQRQPDFLAIDTLYALANITNSKVDGLFYLHRAYKAVARYDPLHSLHTPIIHSILAMQFGIDAPTNHHIIELKRDLLAQLAYEYTDTPLTTSQLGDIQMIAQCQLALATEAWSISDVPKTLIASCFDDAACSLTIAYGKCSIEVVECHRQWGIFYTHQGELSRAKAKLDLANDLIIQVPNKPAKIKMQPLIELYKINIELTLSKADFQSMAERLSSVQSFFEENNQELTQETIELLATNHTMLASYFNQAGNVIDAKKTIKLALNYTKKIIPINHLLLAKIHSHYGHCFLSGSTPIEKVASQHFLHAIESFLMLENLQPVNGTIKTCLEGCLRLSNYTSLIEALSNLNTKIRGNSAGLDELLPIIQELLPTPNCAASP